MNNISSILFHWLQTRSIKSEHAYNLKFTALKYINKGDFAWRQIFPIKEFITRNPPKIIKFFHSLKTRILLKHIHVLHNRNKTPLPKIIGIYIQHIISCNNPSKIKDNEHLFSTVGPMLQNTHTHTHDS